LFVFCYQSKKDTLLINETPNEENPFHYIFAVTTTCDLIASTLGNIGLLWVPASIWQMMRGSIIIFSGILSIIFLGKRLKSFNWFGMFVVLCGLILVGASSILKGSSGSKTDSFLVAIGIVFVLGAQLIAATQMVIQEFLLKTKSYHPTNVVFMEGFWGVLIMVCVVLPITYTTPGIGPIAPPYNLTNLTENAAVSIYHENTLDALFQISRNSTFLMIEICIVISIALFNIFGLNISKYLSAVHRTLIDTCRTVFVWAVQVLLLLIDPVTFAKVGEPLTMYSLLQLGGFVLLIFGTLVYNKIIKLPCFARDYAEEI